MLKILFILVLSTLFLFSPVLSGDPGLPSAQHSIIFISDGTGSLNSPSTYEGVTQRELLTAQLGPIFNTLRDKQNVNLIVLRLCGETDLLYEGDILKKNLSEVKVAAGLVPCPSANGTNIVTSFQTIQDVIEGRPNDIYTIIFCTDGIHEVVGGKQEEAYTALKQLGKQLEGKSIRLFAMLGINPRMRLKWRAAALLAFGNFASVYVCGFSDLVSTMREIKSELEK